MNPPHLHHSRASPNSLSCRIPPQTYSDPQPPQIPKIMPHMLPRRRAMPDAAWRGGFDAAALHSRTTVCTVQYIQHLRRRRALPSKVQCSGRASAPTDRRGWRYVRRRDSRGRRVAGLLLHGIVDRWGLPGRQDAQQYRALFPRCVLAAALQRFRHGLCAALVSWSIAIYWAIPRTMEVVVQRDSETTLQACLSASRRACMLLPHQLTRLHNQHSSFPSASPVRPGEGPKLQPQRSEVAEE